MWRNGDSLLSDIYLLKKGNVKPVKSSFKKKLYGAWCTDVLPDKPHPRFDTKILGKKVWLIRRCLRYLILGTLKQKNTPMPNHWLITTLLIARFHPKQKLSINHSPPQRLQVLLLISTKNRDLWPIFSACTEFLFSILRQSDQSDLTESQWSQTSAVRPVHRSPFLVLT